MRVFISHSTKDKEFVQQLSEAMEEAGATPYLLEDEGKPGTNWVQRMQKAIKECECVITLLTRNGSRSPWVNQELGFASAYGKPIIPVVESNVNPGPLLAGKMYIRLDRRSPATAISRIVSAIGNCKRN